MRPFFATLLGLIFASISVAQLPPDGGGGPPAANHFHGAFIEYAFETVDFNEDKASIDGEAHVFGEIPWSGRMWINLSDEWNGSLDIEILPETPFTDYQATSRSFLNFQFFPLTGPVWFPRHNPVLIVRTMNLMTPFPILADAYVFTDPMIDDVAGRRDEYICDFDRELPHIATGTGEYLTPDAGKFFIFPRLKFNFNVGGAPAYDKDLEWGVILEVFTLKDGLFGEYEETYLSSIDNQKGMAGISAATAWGPEEISKSDFWNSIDDTYDLRVKVFEHYEGTKTQIGEDFDFLDLKAYANGN